MSQKNIATVRRLFDAWKEGPTDVPTDLVAPEIEFISPLTAFAVIRIAVTTMPASG
jgi:ketosteroid isomerase-like protein